MAMIHVARDGATIGSFSREEVQEGLRTGRFLPTDMAWEEGMPDWRPLSQVIADQPAAAMPAPGPAGANALPISSSASSAGASGSGLPWEHRQELGLVKAFFDTVSVVLTKPVEAFAMMKTEGGLIEPMLFALIGGTAGLIVSLLFKVLQQSMGIMATRQHAMAGLFGGIGIVLAIILIPLAIIVGMFIGSGVLHLCLMIVGGARKPFETTFRVASFSFGTTYLLSMIPCCGGLIASIYNLVLLCIGLARSHEIDTGKAVIAVLLPMVVCCGGGLLFSLLLGGGLLTQLWQLK